MRGIVLQLEDKSIVSTS